MDELKPQSDPWGKTRSPDDPMDEEAEESSSTMSIRRRIRLMGKAAVAQRVATVAPAPQTKLRFKGLKRHIHADHYKKIRNINRQTCFNAILSLVLAITSNEIHWTRTKVIEGDTPAQGPITEPDFFNVTTEVIKFAVTINVLFIVFGIFRYYSATLELKKLESSMLPQDTFYSAGYLPLYLFETFVCLIHPLPIVYFTWVKSERGGVKTHYGSDDIFTVLMLPRVYLLFRVFRDSYGMNNENSRYVGSLCRVNLDSAFVTFKGLMQEQPILIVPCLYIFVIAVLSYALCVFERPLDDQFNDIRNGIWVIFVTMTTVGYGDMYPSTDLGRMVAILACASALLILMLLIIGMTSYMAPDAKEFKVFHILKYKRWKSAMKVQGAIVIQSFWRCARLIDRPDQPLMWQTSYAADTKLCFEVRAFRRLRSEEPMEQRDIGTLLWETYKNVGLLNEKLEQIHDTVKDNGGRGSQNARI